MKLDERRRITPPDDSPHLFLLLVLVLVFVSRLLLLGHVRVFGCSLLSEDGLQFVQPLPFDEELTLQLLKKRKKTHKACERPNISPQKIRSAEKNLWRREICGHGVPQGGGDESAAQDGAHVVRHDPLLRHAAVVLQREDDRVVRSLKVEERGELMGSRWKGVVGGGGRQRGSERTRKADSLMALMTSLNRIFEVSV